MKKLFLAIMAVAAIAMVGCKDKTEATNNEEQKKEDPTKPTFIIKA